MKATRQVCIGIDVGGTYTKCVAIDNASHDILIKNQVKTTHDHADGVAAGVVLAFKNCLKEGEISPEEVVFVAHSTTQATNAFVEGDVAQVGVVGVASGGLEGLIAKAQFQIKDIILEEKVGRKIKIHNEFIKKRKLSEKSASDAINALVSKGSQVIVASMAFGVDDMNGERMIYEAAKKQGIPVSMASEVTKLYGLSRRTRTAAVNASIMPKMITTADATEASVRAVGVTAPLMIMRGDGGVMGVKEMRNRPILTMLSGPAASVMGTLTHLRAYNAVYFEVGGTTTSIGVIKNGRLGVDYAKIGKHDTFISSLDVRILGCAGGSMVRISGKAFEDVGPRSAHISGCEYACFTPEEELEHMEIEMISPKPNDPADYVAIRLKNGKRICITNTCAANVLGLVEKQYFAYGNANSARKAMQLVADKLGITAHELATQILEKNFEKIRAIINAFAQKYQLDRESMKFLGCGGGAAALVPYCADKMDARFSIPQNAEIISSIGVALSMVRDVVERVIPNPTLEDIKQLKREAADAAIQSGATPESIDVHIEIDDQTGKVSAIALGSTEVEVANTLKTCSESDAWQLAIINFGSKASDIELKQKTDSYYIFSAKAENKSPVLIIDYKGFIKVQCANGNVFRVKVREYKETVRHMWENLTYYKSDTEERPDFYVCIGPRLKDYYAADIEQLLLLMDIDVMDCALDEEILLVGAIRD